MLVWSHNQHAVQSPVGSEKRTEIGSWLGLYVVSVITAVRHSWADLWYLHTMDKVTSRHVVTFASWEQKIFRPELHPHEFASLRFSKWEFVGERQRIALKGERCRVQRFVCYINISACCVEWKAYSRIIWSCYYRVRHKLQFLITASAWIRMKLLGLHSWSIWVYLLQISEYMCRMGTAMCGPQKVCIRMVFLKHLFSKES